VLREQFIENQHGMNSYLQLGAKSMDFINNKIPFYITEATKCKAKDNKKLEDFESIEDSDGNELEKEYDWDKACDIYSQKKNTQEDHAADHDLSKQKDQNYTFDNLDNSTPQKPCFQDSTEAETSNYDNDIREYKRSLSLNINKSKIDTPSPIPSLPEYVKEKEDFFTENDIKNIEERLKFVCSQIVNSYKNWGNASQFLEVYNTFSGETISIIVSNLHNNIPISKWAVYANLPSCLVYQNHCHILTYEIQSYMKTCQMLSNLEGDKTDFKEDPISDEQLDEMLDELSQLSLPAEVIVKQKKAKKTSPRKKKSQVKLDYESELEVSQKSTPNLKSFLYIQQDNDRSLEQMGQFAVGIKRPKKNHKNGFLPPFKGKKRRK